MALCTSCGSQVEESASFCTSCGKPMPAAAHPSAAVTVMRPVCSSCGAQADEESVFCTECGKRLNAEPAPIADADPAASIARVSGEAAPAMALSTAFCTNCGSKLKPGTGFCTNCGQPTASGSTNFAKPEQNIVSAAPAPEVKQPLHVDPAIPRLTSTELTEDVISAGPVIDVPTPSRAEPNPAATVSTPEFEDRPAVAVPIKPASVATTPVEPTRVEPAPQMAPPLYATPSLYPPAQPGGGAFRVIVLVLLLLIVIGGFGGWYFIGVETVIVCSPPDVKVFLDDKELAPTSYGRYVIPHLSRQPHLLKVQRAGFADTIERLDFPMTSLHEWVNIKLVPRRVERPSRR